VRCLYKYMIFNICIYLYHTCLCQYMLRYNVYTLIYNNMQVYAILYVYIRVYTRIYTYIQIFKKIMHNYGIRTSNLVHTFRRHYHCTASVNTSVFRFFFDCEYIVQVVLSPHSRHLVAGVGHPALDPRRRPRRP
jgi:hypothetical protein